MPALVVKAPATSSSRRQGGAELRACEAIHRQLLRSDCAAPFLQPVSLKEVPAESWWGSVLVR